VSPPSPPSSGPAAVFLSPSGSDAGACTQAAPCRTFDRAYRAAQPGQTVQLAGGSYGDQTINADASKTSTADVVLQPAAGASVTAGTIDIHGADHLTLQNMTVSEWHTFQGTDDVTIRNVTTSDFYIDSSSNVSVVGGSVGPQVDNDDAQIRPACADCPLPTNILLDGVYFHDATLSSGSDAHVECLQVAEIDGLTIRNSRFNNCQTHNVFISPWWGTLERNVLLENNFGGVVRTGYYGFRVANGGGTCDNVVYRYNSAVTPFLMECGTVRNGAKMIANVGPITAGLCESYVTYSHNVWNGAACGPTDLNAPSGFVNASASDLRLQAGSAAINHGDPSVYPAVDIDGNARPLGGLPDAGASEQG
jgi:hypothetical protein